MACTRQNKVSAAPELGAMFWVEREGKSRGAESCDLCILPCRSAVLPVLL